MELFAGIRYFHEQSVMTVAYYEIFQRETIVLPLCLLQSFWSGTNFKQWQIGHFSFHAVNMKNLERLNLFQHLSNLTNYSELILNTNRECLNNEFLTY